jgi:cellulose synthase/poly-beta-1,6-N-acetylglucosamine synthase-like glycosyltransferase
MIGAIVLTMVGLTSILLFAFGTNLLYLTLRATRLQRRRGRLPVVDGEPLVCVQVPIYNERYVAERVLNAVCDIDWPWDRLEIQVLDDSDDDTTSIIARHAERLRRQGVQIAHVRRGLRTGFKAGALAHGLSLTDAPFIAIFDADFVPQRDFLRRMLGVFEDPSIAFAQARWGHLNERYSWLTRVQALAIDFHFVVERAVHLADGCFTNFTGTAGVWRRVAIEGSGGWSADTLTEDLDLSYRAQLLGWRAAYVEDLVVPEELPVSIDAYRRQQSRWATGTFQSAFKLLIPVLRSHHRGAVKLQAAIHLVGYGLGPLMLLQLMTYPALIFVLGRQSASWSLAMVSVVAVVIALVPWLGFIVAQVLLGRRWWSSLLPAMLCQVIGAGMSLTATLAMLRATRPGGQFIRTPKHRIERRGQEWRDQAYVRVGDPRALGEAGLGLGAIALVPLAASMQQWLLAFFTSMFALGFLTLASHSAVDTLEVLALRNLGRRALARLRGSAAMLGLLALCALVLLFAAQMAEPFEDGYGHWLIAANLASTGILHDPLFGMEDTWLPGYHLLAAAVLHVFGLWQLGALKVLGALLGTATLAGVYALAPNVRQSRLAVALLALNPVFLFTSGTAVVEPLLTALLTSAALAAVRRQMKLATLLSALACATTTKAWIWVGTVAAFAAVELWRRNGAAWGRPAIAWAVPAIALLVFLQLGFSPASNSVARGSLEVASATARGSLPAGGMARVTEVAQNFGLAALPLFTLGLVGLFMALRNFASAVERTTLRFVYLPAAVYLAAVFGLVAIGAYSGSHRYLYPALPALALLAAAALDRHSSLVRTLAVASGGLLTIAYIPVFAGFAADNAGLIAAGKATRGDPGVMVTDSPVAAFYSGKPPRELTGSRNLPTDRTQAIAWLRVRGVTDLVLENISYYRATVVFPDLAHGQASLPFESLGDQATYRVAGGKQAYAYRISAAYSARPIYADLTAVMSPMPAQGKTAVLAKGLALRAAGTDIAGEGMGFGLPMVHYPDGWVYSRTTSTIDLSTAGHTIWKRTFNLDEIGVDAARDYRPIASRGRIEVTYTLNATGVLVEMVVLDLVPGYLELGILNEQSAAFDNFADQNQTLIGPEFGRWIPVNGTWARLRSATFGVEWSVPAIPGAHLNGGRELSPPGFDWAGLDYLFDAPPAAVTYQITVQAAR